MNNQSLYDKKIEKYERAVTFDGDEQFSRLEPFAAEHATKTMKSAL